MLYSKSLQSENKMIHYGMLTCYRMWHYDALECGIHDIECGIRIHQLNQELQFDTKLMFKDNIIIRKQ